MSSAMPRKRAWQRCTCACTNPGITAHPRASMMRDGASRAASTSPTATIPAPSTSRSPLRTRSLASHVTTVPPRIHVCTARLPSTLSDRASPPVQARGRGAPPSGRGCAISRDPGMARILVVNDSPTLRKVVTSILERHGYDAIAAADGLIALEALENAEVPIDLVLARLRDAEDERLPVLPRRAHERALRDAPGRAHERQERQDPRQLRRSDRRHRRHQQAVRRPGAPRRHRERAAPRQPGAHRRRAPHVRRRARSERGHRHRAAPGARRAASRVQDRRGDRPLAREGPHVGLRGSHRRSPRRSPRGSRRTWCAT